MADFRVWCPEHDQGEEDARLTRANADWDAAERWAEHDDCNSADYLIANGATPIVHVRSPDGAVTRWRVRAEVSPTYYADPVEDEA